LVDPWVKNPLNPEAKEGKDPIAALGKVDDLLVTHGHGDHVGDAVEIAKRTGAALVANFELGSNLAALQGFPEKQMGFATLMNIGGVIEIADGTIEVFMTPAVHSSGLETQDSSGKKYMAYGGNSSGYVLKIKNGPTIYHSGDTAYFSDMKLIGEKYPIDLALLNIGGHFGMSPSDAARTAAAIRAKSAIPHHFKTFPILTQDGSGFASALKKNNVRGIELAPGAEAVFEGKRLTSERTSRH